ncbi:MAG: shikimate dehydrogenase [Lachnospiraceae bacterium]|nr:shikimate dehydrogenase [Lachnospiraceae bacterium]
MEYGLIGEKLGHSYSKQIHESLADYTYEIHPVAKEEFDSFMRKKEFQAINVTIPYKQDVLPYLDELDKSAEAIGAVNTIVNRGGRLYGYNTDYIGFIYTLKKFQIEVANKKVLVLGNGGASKAVLAALRDLNAGTVLIVKYKVETGTITYEEAATSHSDAPIIINTSPVGMYPNTGISPIDLTPYHSLEAAVDLIYNPLETKFLADAKRKGALTANGLPMLVAQAKYASEFFTDVSIKDDVIDPLCKKIEDMMNKNS